MTTTRIIVLLRLKQGRDRRDYETWAKSTDLPTVNALSSVASFSVHQMTGLLGAPGDPPYDYIEVIDVIDMEVFSSETQSPAMQAIAAEFVDWADPVFITTRNIADLA